MNKLIAITSLILLSFSDGFSQVDKNDIERNGNINNTKPINGRTGPSIISIDTLIEKGAFLMINNVLIRNKKQILFFINKYEFPYQKFKYFDKRQFFLKWNIDTELGVLQCNIEKVVVDLF